MSRVTRAFSLAIAAVAVLAGMYSVGAAAGARSPSTPPDAGRLDPNAHFDADGDPRPDTMPRLIPVASGEDGVSPGFVSREELFPEAFGRSERADGRQTVVDEGGDVVGYMYPNQGFVSLDEAQRPGFEPTAGSPATTIAE